MDSFNFGHDMLISTFEEFVSLDGLLYISELISSALISLWSLMGNELV